ncbi:MAG: hypothetical protein KIT87_05070 [Anaerolineae bacterium]|nr:hypothetical protein [Anaerolineae bacterium]
MSIITNPLIEAALRRAIAEERRRLQNERDLAIINRVADRLNEEADDVLLYVKASQLM